MGWDEDDVAEELKAANPSKRVEKYMELFQKYYSEARRLLEQGDYTQAAATALIKLHAALISRVEPRQAVQLPHNVKHRQAFRDMLKAAEVMHKYFYEKDLDPATFKDHWEDAVRHIEKVKDIVLLH